MSVKLYTSATCSNCPEIKKQLDEAGIQYELLDVADPNVRDDLFDRGTRSVPYLEAVNKYGSEHKALGKAINIKSLLRFLND